MARLSLPLLCLLCLWAPRASTADDAALAAKDAEIAALQAAIAEKDARIAELTQSLSAATRALEVCEREITALRGSAPAPGIEDLAKGQETSREQMKYLHYCFKTWKPKAGEPQWPALDGKNFVLWLVAVGQIEKDKEGPLQMLFSPADRTLKFPGIAAYLEVTTASLAKQRFPRLTSYAGRRNSVKELAITPESVPATTALFADLSLGDGALVAFLDGKVKYVRRADLGLAPTDPLVAGPASRSPLLQTLSAE